ncbi:MAG: D-alanyl-D-alanine carboxypeptidase/D-alanyl-D-alanine-endopeptidase [Rhodothermales bacterium]
MRASFNPFCPDNVFISTLLIGLVFLLPAAFVPAIQAQPTTAALAELQEKIAKMLGEEQFDNAIWGAKIVNIQSGEVLFEQHAEKSLMPASNAKLYTTAAALDLLGADFRYETVLFSDGPIQNGVLKGNLIIRGSGDPTIGARYVDGDPALVFRNWARALRNLNITQIEGDIIGDDDLFDDLLLGYGWSWDDEPYYYSAEIGALTFYDNSIRFILEGQHVDEPGKLRWEPFNTSYVDVVNSSITVHPDSSDDIEYSRRRNFNTIEAIGEIYPAEIDTSYITVSNPTKYFTHVLREVLVQEGIVVKGRPVDVDELSIKPKYNRAEQLLVHRSPPLSEIIVILNKESQNLYAELLIRTIGVLMPVAGKDKETSSAEMGVFSAKETYGRARMDTSLIKLLDGSGLSRMNLVTANMTADLLKYMWNHRDKEVREAYYNSLPIGGIDGTLEDRFRRSPTFRNVRAKTGTLTGASSLSGYVSTAAGTPVLFVLMCNNYTVKTSAVRRTQNAIVTLLARYMQ